MTVESLFVTKTDDVMLSCANADCLSTFRSSRRPLWCIYPRLYLIFAAVDTLLMTRPPLLTLLLTDLPQLIDLWRISRERPLHHLHAPADHVPPRGRIRNRLRLHLDDPDPRIIRPTIMFPIPEIPQPGLQGGAVVFLDGLAIGQDVGGPGDRCPFACGIEEGDVD
jgi:hypothetical protein